MIKQGFLIFSLFYPQKKMYDKVMDTDSFSHLNLSLLLPCLNFSPNAICCVNSKAEILFCNTVFKKIFTRLRTYEGSSDWLNLFIQENREFLLHKMIEQNSFSFSSHELTFEGCSDFALSVSYSLVKTQDKYFHFFIFQDLSFKKQTENILYEAIKEAEAGNRAKGNFLTMISHELRTPLNGIFGLLNLLEDTELSTEQKQYLGMIKNSSETLFTIIKDVLDYTAVEEDALILENTPFDLMQIIDKIIEIFSPSAKIKGLAFHSLFLWKDPQLLVSDGSRIYKILFSLMSNAIKFTSRGEVGIRMECLEQLPSSVRLKIHVTDTGKGISDLQKDIVFSLFSQLDSTTTREYGGLGLGLALCKKIIHLMNGEIGFESNEDEGSDFWIYLTLPLDQKIHDKKQKKTSPLVLFKDDSPEVETLLKQMDFWEAPYRVFLKNSPFPDFIKGDFSSFLIDVREKDTQQGILLLIEQILKNIDIHQTSFHLMIFPDEMEKFKSLFETGSVFCLRKPFRPSELYALLFEKPTFISAPKTQEDNILFPANILLIDDNAMNRFIATRLLKKAGCHVDGAEKLLQASDLLTNRNYDLIFLACQLPEQDGYQTSKIIRAMKGMEYIPIIALTSRPFSEYAQKGAESGMNDFLPKPITYNAVLKILKKWFSRDEDSDVPIFDARKLMDITGGDKEIYNQAALLFLEELDTFLHDLKSAYEKNDFTQAELTAHTLKGSSAYLGAERLKRIALKMEFAARQKDRVQFQSQYDKFLTEKEKLLSFIHFSLKKETESP